MDAQELIFENHFAPASLSRVFRLPDATTIAAASGFVAALIHAVVTREHLAHWWGYGAFFAGLAVVQAVAAVLIVRRPGLRLYLAVVASNAAVLALYALSRTLGTSFVGPHAGQPEAVGFIDLAAAAAEVAQILVLVPLLRSQDSPARASHAPRWIAAALIAVAAAGFVAPVGAVHATPAVDLLLTASDDTSVDLHDQHPEEIIPTPTPPAEEEAILEEPAPEPCTPRLADPSGVPPKASNGEARAIVYADEGDLYLAAPPNGDVRRLTRDGWDCGESTPAFKDADTVAFSADSTIYDLDLRSGTLRKVLDVDGGLSAFSWNDDGSTVAYLTWGDEKNPPALSVFTPSTGITRRLRTFSAGGGRCGSMDDEISITWSPDGRAVLVVATVFDFSKETLFAVNLNGKDILAPRLGTHALWGSDSETVIYREFIDSRRWFSLDIDTGRSTLLPMKAGTHHASMSPDGRRIAYSDEVEKPALFVYDLATRSERVLTRGYAAALWLSSNEIAATQTKACVDAECGGHGEWMMGDAAAIFDLAGSRGSELSVTNTMDADALLDGSAAPPAPAPSTQPPVEPSSSPTVEPTPSPEPTVSPIPSPTASPSS